MSAGVITPSRVRLALILGALIALGPLTIDTYLPALPEVGRDLAASGTTVQLTLTGTLAGLALGQILIGPLSDAYGRRLPLLAGTALHVLASALVAVAPTVELLTVLRVLQGVGASAGAVVGLTIVRDLFTGRAAATMLSRLMLVMGAAPVLAPTLGAGLLTWVSWRGVFLFLAGYGLVMLAVVTAGLPETLPVSRRRPARFGSTVRTYGMLLRDRTFVGLVLVAGLAMGALFSYVSGASYVFQQQFGVDQQTFGLLFGAGAVWLVVGTQLNPVLLRYLEPRRVLSGGIAAGVLAGIALLVLTATGTGGLPAVLAGVWILLLACGFVMPNAPALALARHGETAGTAAALLGALQFGIGAATSPVVGLLGNDAAAMGASMFGAVALAGLSLVLVVRPWTLPDLNEEPVPAGASSS
ncbi:Multidrug resistance transporter, Bcr/CflA family [Pseudonocardia sp. Ae168_Ps1]|uniref:multidrug effflux MFS transporter n=1 Tax=unclassified Pseudonocardia TaxID=2619320 RepID=UPI00095D6407|nr:MULTISPECIES: multidrug effflux MFS transporter [unclassified Pseudonocardia]OLL74778.1 Multidrug resistance transporter, Bcr/CflA family [Pseudonocardia sp. Ae150A_Ps1]OLL80770.1 Multidrug resistance transporter, Bcr/CflA family [Pseudonocardia sp. Ae168_Ps1]OLL85112.1 Multidrug resistance transporter, Bcr/CflA family [Pseudonocardia sp. Ae263_Ps1]OLL94871.1 Multidrug resistance transporter, Bcr/CflA family [Pseudonocardia sp. Ae356_Ps1]